MKPKSDLRLPCSEPFPSLSAVHGVYGGGERGRRVEEDGVGKPKEEQEKTWSENKLSGGGGSAQAVWEVGSVRSSLTPGAFSSRPLQ